MANYADIPPAKDLSEANRQRDAWIDDCAQMARNADYYRGLLTEIAVTVGAEAYTADDGSVHDTPLCVKLPEIIRTRLGAVS